MSTWGLSVAFDFPSATRIASSADTIDFSSFHFLFADVVFPSRAFEGISRIQRCRDYCGVY